MTGCATGAGVATLVPAPAEMAGVGGPRLLEDLEPLVVVGQVPRQGGPAGQVQQPDRKADQHQRPPPQGLEDVSTTAPHRQPPVRSTDRSAWVRPGTPGPAPTRSPP